MQGLFGYWLQTIADLEFLDLELRGIAKEYQIDCLNKKVFLEGDKDWIKERVAHLEKVEGEKTLYAEFVEIFGDTNAYVFHNLYPYKGKFYPRLVRTLINAFALDKGAFIFDPFNGSGTTTHEASLMGIKSVGIDITPVGTTVARVKNGLLFISEKELDFSESQLKDVFETIERKAWKHDNQTIQDLMLLLYFDTVDAFERTSRYGKSKNKENLLRLFTKKFQYIKGCLKKTNEIKEKHNLEFVSAGIMEGDALEMNYREVFDACITSPPYFFSVDYVGQNKVAYEYLEIEQKEIRKRYLGMKERVKIEKEGQDKNIPPAILQYFEDLRKALEKIYIALKPQGWLALVVGDSTVDGKVVPTTERAIRYCKEVGFQIKKVIFNPLLGARNRAIRGESVIIGRKMSSKSNLDKSVQTDYNNVYARKEEDKTTKL